MKSSVFIGDTSLLFAAAGSPSWCDAVPSRGLVGGCISQQTEAVSPQCPPTCADNCSIVPDGVRAAKSRAGGPRATSLTTRATPGAAEGATGRRNGYARPTWAEAHCPIHVVVHVSLHSFVRRAMHRRPSTLLMV